MYIGNICNNVRNENIKKKNSEAIIKNMGKSAIKYWVNTKINDILEDSGKLTSLCSLISNTVTEKKLQNKHNNRKVKTVLIRVANNK